jgi:hypothetical protein
MKGPRLIIFATTTIALVFILVMVTLNLAPSWSQYARTELEQLLFVPLACIGAMWFTRAYNHWDKEVVLFKWPVTADLKQVNVWAGFMFLGIICTPVTIGLWWVELLHYLFTVAGILFAYSEITNYYEHKAQNVLAWIGLGLAAAGMLAGYFTDWWTLGVGELIAATPVAIHVLVTNKNVNTN